MHHDLGSVRVESGEHSARISDFGQGTLPRRISHLALRIVLCIAMFSAGLGVITTTRPALALAPSGSGFEVTPADLAFILEQIQIAEAHASGVNNTSADPCAGLLGTGPNQITSPLLPFGLRTVDGSCNHLQAGQEHFGAASRIFPRLTTPEFRTAEAAVFGPPGITSYAQTSGSVFDSQPRIISNLIVDQTATNPAAVAVAENPFRTFLGEPVVACLDATNTDPADCNVPFGETLPIENVTTDVGLSPPFNALFTFFGQFFDHGVDKITNGGNGVVFVPLQPDDPLYVVGSPTNFMVLTRGTQIGGVHEAENTDSPFVDQSQTYTSNASHQVFLREYVNNTLGRPVSTGAFLDDPAHPKAIASWMNTKDQARDLLGIQLEDTDVNNIPMILTDPYGKFIPGPDRGLPQLVTNLVPLTTVEGDTLAPVVPSVVGAQRVGIAFLNDIAHAAGPGAIGTPKTPDADLAAGGSLDPVVPGEYDDELLDLHMICGDGRCNENIALTSVHQVFHSEHNRLAEEIKLILLADTSGVTNLADWQLATGAAGWNGERLFQAARFITEMEYQHLVFEEFARKIQPLINPFEQFALGENQANPAIVGEFAHAVYRFGHSMLTDNVPRINPDPLDPFHYDVSLFDGFLNPAEYFDTTPGPGQSGPVLSSEDAAGGILMGVSDEPGQEIDEFVADTLRNRLVGLPLDLPVLNLSRGREQGIPRLNDFRRQVFASTNDGALAPYTDWVDFGENLKYEESLTNFVAAYGTHPSITVETTIAGKREAAELIAAPVTPADFLARPADSDDFMFGTGAWANVAGETVTGVDDVDLWVGGLAERTNLFGGHLGNTFNYVFEYQLTTLQDDDRFYYLARTPGMNLQAQLEGNSFAELVQRNTNTHTLKSDAFSVADCKFELGRLITPATSGEVLGAGSVQDDPLSDCNENHVLLEMANGTIRYRLTNLDDPPGLNAQIVMNGTSGVDRMWGGVDSDTFWGNEANDVIEGGDGGDTARGGAGNDIITDSGGDDIHMGGEGNDAIDGGPGLDLLLPGAGHDFTNGGSNINETFAGTGDDFVIAGTGADLVIAGSGDDWLEGGTGPDLLVGDSSSFFFDDHDLPGNDIIIGQTGDDDYDGEGGDDILVSGPGLEKNSGTAGFDWVAALGDPAPNNTDLTRILVNAPPVNDTLDRFDEVEGASGWDLNDILRGTSVAPKDNVGIGMIGCNALDADGVERIVGLDQFVTTLPSPSAPVIAAGETRFCNLAGPNVWGEGEILIGGSGSDILEGRGNDDILDGDAYLSVRLSVRTDRAIAATEIGSAATLTSVASSGSFGPGTAGMSLQQAVFAGLVDPGSIVAVREILMGSGAIDTAVYSGESAEYTITTDIHGVTTVAHTDPPVPLIDDGVDRVTNVERLQFTDVVIAIATAFNSPATGTVTIDDATPTENQLLTATPAIVDPDGFGAVTLTWQSETAPGVWVAVGTGTTFTPNDFEVGNRLRVVATFLDNVGVAETVTGDPTLAVVNVNDAPVGVPSLSTSTPEVASPIVADVGPVSDEDGLLGATFSYQWQANGIDIGGATSTTFVPTFAQAGAVLRVRVEYTDDHGTPETVFSADTAAVAAPAASVAPPSLSFGTGETTTVSAAQDVTLTNTGDANLLVSSATIVGPDAGSFVITANGCTIVGAGGDCTISVAFAPTTNGAKSATLQINHNANPATSSASLSGTGVTNQEPTFNQDLGNRTDAEGDVISLDAGATDGDGNPLTYEATNLPPGLLINNATGLITGTISFVAAAGSPYNVSITVRDGATVDATDTFVWTVTNTNRDPVFNQDLGDRTDAEADVISLSAAATDLDGEAVFYGASGLPIGLSINPVTGEISGTISFVAAALSPYNVTITVQDGVTVDATDTFVWTVTNTNREPAFNQDLGDRSDAEADLIALSAAAVDPDGDSLTYAATGLPPGLSINTSSGLITGTLSFTASGAHNVSITVQDGVTVDATDSFVWTVTNTNREPAFDQDLGDRTDAENAPITLSAAATDPDNDALTYTATNLPPGLSINPSTGLITGTITFDASATSPYSVSITVQDGVAVDATDTFVWTVTNTNREPTFNQNLANRSTVEGLGVSLSAAATDPDGDALLYAATGLPPGLSINTSTGLITGTLPFTASGTYNVSITVRDGVTVDATDTFVWTIVDTPDAPTSVSAVPGNGQATVSWVAPVSNGGSPITGYTVTPFIGATAQTIRTFNNTAATQVITGLTNGTIYTFRVRAFNVNGTGPASASGGGSVDVGTPTSPRSPIATPGNAAFTASWTAPLSNNGAAVTGYVVTPFVGATALLPRTFNNTATSQFIGGLTNGTTYTFRVAAINSRGTGPQSVSSAAVIAGTPTSPTGVSAVAGPTAGRATVSWTAPSSTNGAAITGYAVTPFIGGVAQTPRTFASTATTQQITGLTPGTAYTFRVAATNSRGTGPNSGASNSVTVP